MNEAVVSIPKSEGRGEASQRMYLILSYSFAMTQRCVLDHLGNINTYINKKYKNIEMSYFDWAKQLLSYCHHAKIFNAPWSHAEVFKILR
jgi:hypothetical protein